MRMNTLTQAWNFNLKKIPKMGLAISDIVPMEVESDF